MRNKTATAARDTGRRAPEGQSVAPLLLSPSLVISHWHVASFCCSREYRTAGFLTASGMGRTRRGPQGRRRGTRECAVPAAGAGAQAGAGAHSGHGMGDARGLAGLSHRLVTSGPVPVRVLRSTLPRRPRDTHPPGRCVGEHRQAPEVWEKLIGTRRDRSLAPSIKT